LKKNSTKPTPEGLYVYLVSHEWEENDDDKRALLREILDVAPDLGAAYQKLANLTEDKHERLALIETGLSCDPDAETAGMLQLNKAAIVNLDGRRTEAIDLLARLILAPDTTSSNTAIAKAVLYDLHAGQK
jgi:hypothetical protein